MKQGTHVVHAHESATFTCGRAHINCSRSLPRLNLLPSLVIVKRFKFTLVFSFISRIRSDTTSWTVGQSGAQCVRYTLCTHNIYTGDVFSKELRLISHNYSWENAYLTICWCLNTATQKKNLAKQKMWVVARRCQRFKEINITCLHSDRRHN